VVLSEEEAKQAPATMKLKDMTGLPGFKFGMTVSTLDCMGCGACVNVCPGNNKAETLVMVPMESQLEQQEVFDYGITIKGKPEVAEKFKESSVKGSQFKKPLLEFSGACAGCGKHHTQNL
jgi:pyruvate-ferredoxin/flavodoxin oxidoreductase